MKNLNKIHSNDKKKTLVFKTLKSKLYENNFYIELQRVLNDLLNDKDTEDYGKYFKSMYSDRVVSGRISHIRINTYLLFRNTAYKCLTLLFIWKTMQPIRLFY